MERTLYSASKRVGKITFFLKGKLKVHGMSLSSPSHVPDQVATLEVPDKSATGKRSFQIKVAKKEGKEGEEHSIDGKNRYVSKSPAGAARKAASRVFRECYKGVDEECKIYLVIRETTKDSKKTEYSYLATRSKSNEDRVCTFNKDKEGGGKSTDINFKYNVTLKSDREAKVRKTKKEEETNEATTAAPETST
jgi:hypothetical protein